MTRLRVGQVFTIPTGDGRVGVGQVVASYGKDAYFLAVFDRVYPLDEMPDIAMQALVTPPLFLALSMDAKIHTGDWTLIGDAPVSPLMPLPAYKEAVGVAGNFDVVDYSGRRRRSATAIEAQTLPNRKVVAPVRLERALRASLGLEQWLEPFNELRLSGQVTTADLFGP